MPDPELNRDAIAGLVQIDPGSEGFVHLDVRRRILRSFQSKIEELVAEADNPGQIADLFKAAEEANASGYPVSFSIPYSAGIAWGQAARAEDDRVIARVWNDGFTIRNFKRGTASGIAGEFSGESYDPLVVREIREAIASGRVYQVNYTIRKRFRLPDGADLWQLFWDLAHTQNTRYAMLAYGGERQYLSVSPELFARWNRMGRILCEPMKGTRAREFPSVRDTQAGDELRSCEKDRAENAMITDLIRNDLGRIARFGSVITGPVFRIERFPTLWQMTSLVRARLRQDVGLSEVFQALFPSGSVTGAPKIAAMKMIESIEKSPRGIYTGCLGYTLPGGSGLFNVAIRTLEVSGNDVIAGTGSGVTWDSSAASEQSESRLKLNFLHGSWSPEFLFETLLVNESQARHAQQHILRLSASAVWLCWLKESRKGRLISDLSDYLNAVLRALPGGTRRLRLMLFRDLSMSADSHSFDRPGYRNPPVVVYPDPVDTAHPAFFHKSSDREVYKRMELYARERGAWDAILINHDGRVTESSRANLFYRFREEKVRFRWFTPPVEDGLLPGILRGRLLKSGRVSERSLTREELTRADLWLGNSLRGLFQVRLVSR